MEPKLMGSVLALSGLVVHELEEATYGIASALGQPVLTLVDELLSRQPYHLLIWLGPVVGGTILMRHAVVPWLTGILDSTPPRGAGTGHRADPSPD